MSSSATPQNIKLQSVLHNSQRHELELLGDRHRLEAFFSQSPDGFFFMMLDRPIQWNDSVDQDVVLDYVFKHQHVTKVNASMLAQYDAAEDEFLGLTPQDFFAHDIETGRQLWREMFDKGRLHVETAERKLDGTSMWIEGDYNCLYNTDGEIIGHFGIQREISDRKQAEEALRQSQQELTDFVENAIVCLHWVASDGTIIWANQAELDLLGYTREEYIGHSITEFHADQAIIGDILQRLLSNQPVQDYEAALRCKDGSIRHVMIDSNSSWSNGKFVRTRCFTRDITDRKQAEEALKQSEQRFRAIFDGTLQFIGLLTPEGILIEANRPALDAIAVQLDDVVGQPFWATPWWTHSPLLQTQLKEGITKAAQGELVRFEAEHILADGSSVFVDFSLKPVFDEVGKVVMLIPEGRDINDRKQAEQEVRTLTENAPDIIARFDRNLRYLYVNSAVEMATGLSVQEVLGKTSHDLGMPETQVNQWEEVLNRVFNTGAQTTFDFEVPTSSGVKYYQSRCVPEFALDGSVRSVLGITRDLTEQKQLETQLLRAQRMESLGTLASGIAHDMNNILAPMLASAQLLPVLIPTLDEQSRQLLKIFEDSSRRGAELVKQILAFARGIEGERMAVQVKHLLAELEQIVQSTFPKSIKIVHNFPNHDLWMVSANPTQLHQVFMNLFVNARDAMPEGGTLRVTAENQTIDDLYVRQNLDAKVGAYVTITFTDTGTGIAPEQIDRIFEPFFTTKSLGSGTGLGLSTALGIIKNHGGFMTVESEVGKGTQFQVFLPAIASTETPPEASPELLLGKGELILVADDEGSIRDTLKIILETQNYQVLLANDGIEAIATYAQHQRDIKVIFIDMMMPLMDGLTTIRALQKINPQVKIIAFSGMATRNDLTLEKKVHAFLKKPFSADELLQTLDEVLST